MQETWVRSLGLEDTLEKGKSTHSSFLAWRIPWSIHGVAKIRTRLNDFRFHFPPGKPLPLILRQNSTLRMRPMAIPSPPPSLSDPLRPPSPPDLQPPWPSSRRLHLPNSAFTSAVPFAWYTLPYTAPSSQLKFLLASPCGLQDFSSPTRYQTQALAAKALNPNRGTSGEFPLLPALYLQIPACSSHLSSKVASSDVHFYIPQHFQV